MIGRYTSISPKQIKRCNTCGSEIFFVQNRNGKWFPVDVVYPGTGEHHAPAYKHSAGAHNNLTPWHKCPPQRDFKGEDLVREAQRLSLRIAQKALANFRANPDPDSKQMSRLCAVQDRAVARVVRRISRLPDGSKPYVNR